MKLHERICIALGEFMDGPDEEFPETESDKALGWVMAFCTAVAILLTFC